MVEWTGMVELEKWNTRVKLAAMVLVPHKMYRRLNFEVAVVIGEYTLPVNTSRLARHNVSLSVPRPSLNLENLDHHLSDTDKTQDHSLPMTD